MHFLRIVVDGETVLEMPTKVYNAEKAWLAFTTTFSAMAPQVMGELFETMRRVCTSPEPLPADTPPGLSINIKTKGAPDG